MQPHHVLAAIILQMILALAHQSSAQTVIRRIHAARLPAVRQMQQSAAMRSVHLATRRHLAIRSAAMRSVLHVTRKLSVTRSAVLRSVHLATRKLSVTRRLAVQRKAAAKVATALP